MFLYCEYTIGKRLVVLSYDYTKHILILRNDLPENSKLIYGTMQPILAPRTCK